MSDVYTALIDPFATFGFMRMALVTCLALALSSAPIGTFLLLRRMSLQGDVLSHAVMPGAAVGFLLAGYSLAAMSLGGLATGLSVAGLASLVGRAAPRRSDAVLAAFYLFSLAAGVLIVSFRAGNTDLMNVLFGSVLAVDVSALILIGIVTSVTLLLMAAIYRPLALDSFDPIFARGVGGPIYSALFVALLVLNLVGSFQAFGTLLAIGPMLLPAAAARCLTRRVWPSIVLSVGLGLLADIAGLLLSYYNRLPSGPAIVLCGSAIYAVSLLATSRRGEQTS